MTTVASNGLMKKAIDVIPSASQPYDTAAVSDSGREPGNQSNSKIREPISVLRVADNQRELICTIAYLPKGRHEPAAEIETGRSGIPSRTQRSLLCISSELVWQYFQSGINEESTNVTSLEPSLLSAEFEKDFSNGLETSLFEALLSLQSLNLALRPRSAHVCANAENFFLNESMGTPT